MAHFTGVGVGHLKYGARAVHGLVVEDEPNWLELPPTMTTSEPNLAGAESESDGPDPDDNLEEDPDDETF
jgi:hypothetical protein